MPWQKQQWCIPAVSWDFVYRMEDVLDLYAEPDDPLRPVVCFDERPVQLVDETRVPIAPAPGRRERFNYEYRRCGTANLLYLILEQLGGWRKVTVTERRTNVEFAHQMRDLVDRHFPNAQRIRVVLDNLNSHTGAALYQTFAPEEARRILRNAGVSLYAQARQLAQHGRNRVLRHEPPVPGRTDSVPSQTALDPLALGEATQPRRRHSHLAVHRNEGPRKAAPSLRIMITMAEN